MSDQRSAADEILDATYRALCTHGYAALTMQDIADEAGKSKSLLHYHYDTKEDLLIAFVDRLLTEFEAHVSASADHPPTERLVEFVCWFVFDPAQDEQQSFHIALLELRSQGPFNERIREQLKRSDDQLRRVFAAVLADGIEAGVFEEIDVEETAALLVASLDGARTRQITLDDDAYTESVAEAVLDRVIGPILAADADLPTIEETDPFEAHPTPLLDRTVEIDRDEEVEPTE